MAAIILLTCHIVDKFVNDGDDVREKTVTLIFTYYLDLFNNYLSIL